MDLAGSGGSATRVWHNIYMSVVQRGEYRKMMSTRVNPKNLFTELSEGDKLMFGDRSEPITVYRHVTEDDLDGQVITMKEVTEDHMKTVEWELEHGKHDNDAIRAGDLMTGELTGDEFLIARGPRGGCYLLAQWWSKDDRNQWDASVALYRRRQTDSEVWTWENVVDLDVVGSEDVDRDAFDEGGGWIRHTDVDGRTVWADTLEGDVWTHSEDLTGAAREPTPTDPEPAEVLETVSEGDTITVNGMTATVTAVEDKSDGPLADGLAITLDVDGDEARIRTFSDEGNAALMTENERGDVNSVQLDG